MEVDTPPPKRSDRPPPLLLWRRTKRVRMTLSTHRMMDIVSTGQVVRGAEITSYRVTHVPPLPHIGSSKYA
jgi:hypothetical protein